MIIEFGGRGDRKSYSSDLSTQNSVFFIESRPWMIEKKNEKYYTYDITRIK